MKALTSDFAFLPPTSHPALTSNREGPDIGEVYADGLDMILVPNGLSQLQQGNIGTGQFADFNFHNVQEHCKLLQTVDTTWAQKNTPFTDIWIQAAKRQKRI